MAELERERHGAVEVLRINRPEARNALSPAVIAGIGRGVAEADADPEVGAIVITGTGDRAFCAGMDLRTFAAGGNAGSNGDAAAQAEAAEGMAAYQRFIRDGAAKPVVAAANGAAVAGGFELLLACDMAVAAEEARFGLPEVKRALFPAGGGVFLSRRIPLAQAFELTLTGDLIDAPAAVAMGLINKVVPADQVLSEAIALAGRVTANGPLAVRVTKRLVRAAASSSPDEVWALQNELRDSVFGSEDAKEGATAFVERREPQWKGR